MARTSRKRTSREYKSQGKGLVWVVRYWYQGNPVYLVRYRVPKQFKQIGFWSEHKMKRAALREATRAAKRLKTSFGLLSVKVRR